MPVCGSIVTGRGIKFFYEFTILKAERFSTPQSQRASRPVQRRGTPLSSGQQNRAMFLIGWPGPLTGCTQCCSDPSVASRWSSTAFRCPGALSQTRVWRAPQPPELVSFLPFTCGDKAVHVGRRGNVHPGRAAGIRGPQWSLQPNDVASNRCRVGPVRPPPNTTVGQPDHPSPSGRFTSWAPRPGFCHRTLLIQIPAGGVDPTAPASPPRPPQKSSSVPRGPEATPQPLLQPRA
ncbi:hypothetical protein NDU88_002032 [Pleurodeles waltl]|uniref:Uncharacterized protein n=1 Tax=Pleurodeles waltl TaxID=8319 RepID=A0AAV7LHQ3_PLEWA|nr:hypothetical protein NDU88_002032 [Pleurodeles waltl]